MALTKIELAKSKLALHAGFFISLTSKLRFEESTAIPTAATDGRKIVYNPAFLDPLTLPQTIGLILHEVMHNMLAHPARIGGRNPMVANIAMDIVGNAMLLKYFEETKATLNAELPEGGIYGPEFAKYDGWNWEKVYADLMQQVQKNSGKGQKGADGSGGAAGSGLPQQFDSVMPGTNEDGTPMTPEQQDALAKEWTMAAQQAATMAKQRGKLPGFLEEFVADMVAPKVDWRSQVYDAFTKIAKDEQSWRRFNRRHVHNRLYLPGMYSEHLGLVALYVDTSGSMGTEEFKLAMGCLNEVFEDLKPERIMFGQCDTKMCSEEWLTPADCPLTPRKFHGRGGTILSPMFEHALQMEEEPELVCVISDGYHEVIDKSLQPHCPVVWIITTSSTDAAEQSFGRVIRVEV